MVFRVGTFPYIFQPSSEVPAQPKATWQCKSHAVFSTVDEVSSPDLLYQPTGNEILKQTLAKMFGSWECLDWHALCALKNEIETAFRSWESLHKTAGFWFILMN